MPPLPWENNLFLLSNAALDGTMYCGLNNLPANARSYEWLDAGGPRLLLSSILGQMPNAIRDR